MLSLSIMLLYINVFKDRKKWVEDAITFSVKRKKDALNFEDIKNLLCANSL